MLIIAFLIHDHLKTTASEEGFFPSLIKAFVFVHFDLYLENQRKYNCLFRHVVSVVNHEDKRKEKNNRIKLLRIIFDSFQKYSVALKFFTGVSEIFQTVYILYVLKGVFRLNGNNKCFQSRFGCR